VSPRRRGASAPLSDAPLKPAPDPRRRLGQGLLIAFGLAIALAMVLAPFKTADQVEWYDPWMAQILARGWRAIAGDFANYTPPYIYLLTLASPSVTLIGVKGAFALVNLVFLCLAALQTRAIVGRLTGSPAKGDWAAAALFVVPTVLVNGFLWEQCDIVYTCALLFFLRFIISGRAWLAAVAFGVAVSIKLQAVFLAPLIVCLFLTGRLRVRHLLAVPLVYAAMMVPAWLAGRPPIETFLVYARQADTYHLLSSGAPNIWLLLQHRVVSYELGTKLGLVLAATSVVAVGGWAATRRLTPRALLLIAALSAVVVPYLLPMMHDRYFFPADVLLVLLAFVEPRFWIAAALSQAGSLLAYSEFLGLRSVIPMSRPMSMFGVPEFTLILVWLVLEALRLPPRGDDEPGPWHGSAWVRGR